MSIGNHKTKVLTEGSITKVVYHNTAVFIIDHSTRIVTLNSGGYRTNTTKKRINQSLDQFGMGGAHLYQKNFDWFICKNRNAEPMPFTDNMEISFN